MKKEQSIYELNNFDLDNYNILLYETLFHNANGYIGVRYNFEEGYPENYQLVTSQFINGFYNYTSMKQAEKLHGFVEEKQTMVDIVNTQSIKVKLEDEYFSMYEGTVIDSRLYVDMKKGITVREVIWRSPKGREMSVKITRMASFYQLSLFTIDYEILPINFSGDVVIESAHDGNVANYFDPNDPRTADEEIIHMLPVSCEIINGASYIMAKTTKSELGVCSSVKNLLFQEHELSYHFGENYTVSKFTTKAKKGKKINFIKYTVLADSIRYHNYKNQVGIEMRKALSVPISFLYEKQEEYLSEYWDHCMVEIDGNEDLNITIKYNLYQLLQSVSKDQYGNIASKGLSGEGYEGHIFWDSEMFIQPFFTITNPVFSEKLIENRYATLNMARKNARILGHKTGALFPWRTIMGKECSGYFPSGSAQYHINGDIAYSVISYYLATKDITFIEKKGAEIIFETARIWIDTGNFHEGRFYINDVTGPDEYTCMVNNNYYTNALAQYHLRWAVKFYQIIKGSENFDRLEKKIRLREEEIEEFKNAAENMYLPYDEKLKINPQDDSFLQKKKWNIADIPANKFPLLLHYHPLHLYRYQICKQADTVMAHFILEDAQSMETIYHSFQYYENITTHDSSLSKCIFSIVAAKLGLEEKAYAYFQNTARLDLDDQYKNTKDGIHTANMGGNYMAIVYGFGGFRLKEEGIFFAPMLPKKWKGYRFKICFENSRILVDVNKDTCEFILVSGEAKKITVYNKEYLLKDKVSMDRPGRE